MLRLCLEFARYTANVGRGMPGRPTADKGRRTRTAAGVVEQADIDTIKMIRRFKSSYLTESG